MRMRDHRRVVEIGFLRDRDLEHHLLITGHRVEMLEHFGNEQIFGRGLLGALDEHFGLENRDQTVR